MASLWEKTNAMHDSDGLLNKILVEQGKILEKQKNCQVNSLSSQIKILWVAIVTMALSIIGKSMLE